MTYFFIIVIFLNYFNIHCFNNLNLYIKFTNLSTIFLNINLINWDFFLLDLLKDISFFNKIPPDSTVLINITRNRTNKLLQTINITNTLIELILKNTKSYNVISINQVYDVYREFKISSEEILNSYEFSIKIANYLKADYIIYSMFYEKSENLYLELQLISVKTGEIIQSINKSI